MSMMPRIVSGRLRVSPIRTTAMAEKAVQVGEKFVDPKNDSTVYVVRKGMASGKDLAVAVSNKTGKLTTVMTGSNVVRTRFIPVK